MIRSLLLCACPLLLVGCGGKGAELPVSGTVTVDGQPLPGATVRFIPDGETQGAIAGFAQTDSAGKFVITGGTGKAGLVAGRYKVTVSKGVLKREGQGGEENVGAVVEELDFKDEFPPIYSSPTQTILSYSVTGDGQPIDIKLDSKRKK